MKSGRTLVGTSMKRIICCDSDSDLYEEDIVTEYGPGDFFSFPGGSVVHTICTSLEQTIFV